MQRIPKFEQIINELDIALRTLLPPKQRIAHRPSPGLSKPEANLSEGEKKHIAGLMRVNHAGEVCAQALYQGQALTARLDRIRTQMNHAALEEVDHLAWCEQRLNELQSTPSHLNPLWYCGSFFMGALAGCIGDKWSLGFLAETERQVSNHLKQHLKSIPIHDLKTRVIIEQMDADETQHANEAQKAGAATLPGFIQKLMSKVSKIMTKSSYYL